VETTDEVLDEVAAERRRQNDKWGEQNHSPERWLTILAEEVGEAAYSYLEDDRDNYRTEMVQVAAVAVAAIEAHDRGKGA
jgi:NTP pyrophosphatase (non-canonical NTP hydrolase)